ncbi:MAG: twin-arginine translocation signal domain-containing protein [Bilophila wadsworthia]
MAEQFSRRSFLKGGALTVGAFAFGDFPRIDTAMAAPQEKAKVFFTKDISLEGLMKVYARVNHGMSGKIAIKLHTGEPHGPNILPREMADSKRIFRTAALWNAMFVSQSEAERKGIVKPWGPTAGPSAPSTSWMRTGT